MIGARFVCLHAHLHEEKLLALCQLNCFRDLGQVDTKRLLAEHRFSGLKRFVCPWTMSLVVQSDVDDILNAIQTIAYNTRFATAYRRSNPRAAQHNRRMLSHSSARDHRSTVERVRATMRRPRPPAAR